MPSQMTDNPRQTHAAGWTDDRVAKLKKLHLEGRSATEIARELKGGVTRNGVIGKLHRLGLDGRNLPAKPKAEKAARTSGATSTTSVRVQARKAGAPPPPTPEARLAFGIKSATGALPPEPLPLERVTSKAPLMLPLVQIGAHMCKWPIGDPAQPGFGFCGHRAVNDSPPYCPEHATVALSTSAGPLGKSGKGAAGLERQLRRYL